MKITVMPSDDNGCGSYRMKWPAQALRDQGYVDVEIIPTGTNIWTGLNESHQPLAWIGDAEMDSRGNWQPVAGRDLVTDVLVIQRPLNVNRQEAFRVLQSLGVAVVVEVDDDFTCVDVNNAAYRDVHPRHSPLSNFNHLKRACQMADFVTVSTPALADRFAPHGRVAVLPNCVPESYLDEPAKREAAGEAWNPKRRVRVGWAGAVCTHPGDLNVTRGAIGRLMNGRTRYHSIGPGEGLEAALDVHEGHATGYVELADYPWHVAQLDVGIVPLKLSAFNRAKSWLKGLEMAAVGVPFVASCTPEYERLARLGAGRLAAKPKDWEREVGRLIRDRGWRVEQAEQGREVAKELTIEGNAWKWLAAWSEAGAMRRAA